MAFLVLLVLAIVHCEHGGGGLELVFSVRYGRPHFIIASVFV